MIASMGCMARQAILFHGRMLPHEGASLFRMAFVAKLVHIIRLDHLRPEPTVLIMTLGAFHESLFQGMVGLLVLLRPDILVAGVAKHGRLCLQIHFRPRMDSMAIVTGNAVYLVPAHIPERHGP
jgi:hypothetical protein